MRVPVRVRADREREGERVERDELRDGRDGRLHQLARLVEAEVEHGREEAEREGERGAHRVGRDLVVCHGGGATRVGFEPRRPMRGPPLWGEMDPRSGRDLTTACRPPTLTRWPPTLARAHRGAP